MRSKILLPIVFATLCVGCGANIGLTPTEVRPQEASRANDIPRNKSFYDLTTRAVDTSINNTYPENNNLMPFLNQNSPIMDEILFISNQSNSKEETITETSFEAFNKTYAHKFGTDTSATFNIPGYVSGNIALKFNASKQTKEFFEKEERFETWSFVVEKYIANIDWDNPEISKHFTAPFQRDLDNMKTVADAVEFLSKFGSHVFRTYTFGGALELSKYYAKEKTTKLSKSEMDIESSLTANIDAAKMEAKANTTCSFSSAEETDRKDVYSKINMTSMGGTMPIAHAEDIFEYNPQIVDAGYQYEKWSKQFDDPTTDFAVVRCDKPRPIWTLLSDSEYKLQKDLMSQAYSIKTYSAFAQTSEEYGIGAGFFDSLTYKVDQNDYNLKLDSSQVYLPKGTDFKVNYSEFLSDKLGNFPYTLKSTNTKVATISGNDVIVDDSTNQNGFELQLYSGNKILNTLNIKFRESEFRYGYGTKQQPYLISNVSDYAKLRDNLDKTDRNYYKLINDIDFKGRRDVLAGINAKGFKGSFDGDNYALKNFNILPKKFDGKNTNIGIFAVNRGVIKNLVVRDCVILNSGTINIGRKNGAPHIGVGVITGYNSSTGVISNCRVYDARVKINGNFKDGGTYLDVGFIAGRNEGKIENSAAVNCLSYVTANNEKIHRETGGLMGVVEGGYVSIGSIAGYSRNAKLNSSYSYNNNLRIYFSNIVNDQLHVGHLYGLLKNSSVACNVTYDCTIEGNKNHHGSIAGFEFDTNDFVSCYALEKPINNADKTGCTVLKRMNLTTISNIDFDKYWVDFNDGVILKDHLGDYSHE